MHTTVAETPTATTASRWLHRLRKVTETGRAPQTASAPPGYRPKHRATRRTPTGSQPDGAGVPAVGEVRWWESAGSG